MALGKLRNSFILLFTSTVGESFSGEVVSESPEASGDLNDDRQSLSRLSNESPEASGDINAGRKRPLATLKRLRERPPAI